MNKYPVVHIYGQYADHMAAFIFGNHDGLLKLRDALNQVLNNHQHPDNCEVYVNDGKGYNIYIKVLDANDIDKLLIPYTADYAKDKRGVNPLSFIEELL